ncbi:hypothetical protein AOL_s00169g157 [Orbilia oligospora ATCC 24927]|uniref:F-box domain-containing protein n=1 Tax=Arthrobotrys oligospora (strain ATCC 24927 / CBS 115.81 / DSM 1491) TaxID=756982 RepID=G1XMV4_ARTOA|nr:hypothetical protein AOL_s00169g157 [Orbilia oligospora ATCC 24927]EGX45551.1 hypothetical protein AOL_s00169g157 [Orbilia oligospora ATCC 24927]
MSQERPIEKATSSTKECVEVARNASSVLSIPELLELILCHVARWPFFGRRNFKSVKDADSLIDLYHCSLVCKFWKGIVDTSPSISRKLWKCNDTQPIPPVEYQKSPFNCQVRTFVREGEFYPTINYPFISWLAWRVPGCFRDEGARDIRNLHDQYIQDKFPSSYFSNPPTTEVLIELGKLEAAIHPELCKSEHISAIWVSHMNGWSNPSQSFIVRHENGVTVKNIIEAIATLMDPKFKELYYNPDPVKSNIFREMKVGIFRQIEQEAGPGDQVNCWALTTRYGSFMTGELGETQTYEISNKSKLYAGQRRD